MRRQWISSRRCQLCLSATRALHAVADLRGPYHLITGLQLSSKQACERHVCWECRAILHRLIRFRRQARYAQSVLDSVGNNTRQHITSLSSLSTLEPYSICISIGEDKNGLHAKRLSSLLISPVVTYEFRDGFLFHSEPITSTAEDNFKAEREDFIDDDRSYTEETPNDADDVDAERVEVQVFTGTDEDIADERSYTASSAAYREATYKCMSCLVGLSSLQMFKQHIKSYHTKSCGDKVCGICQSRFTEQGSLEQHSEQHKQLFACSHGDFIGRTRETILDHIKSEHPKEYSRLVKEGQKFVDVSEAIEALTVVPENKSEEFTTKEITEEELKAILDEKRNQPAYKEAEFKCNSCYLGFQNSKNWKRHHRLFKHIKTKRDFFKCEACAKGFELLDTLQEHAKTHRKLYTCLKDDFSSVCPQNMYRHMQSEHILAQSKENKRAIKRKTVKKQTRKPANPKLTKEEKTVKPKIKKEATTAKSKIIKEAKTARPKVVKVAKTAKVEVLNEEIPTSTRNNSPTPKVRGRKRNRPASDKPKKKWNEKPVRLRRILRHNKCEKFTPTEEQVRTMREIFQFKPSRKNCDDCVAYFGNEESYFEHRKLHSEAAGAHECDICKLRFTTPELMKKHRETHYVWYRCTLDPDTCQYITHMPRPMAVHIYKKHKPYVKAKDKKERYECDICSKVFTTWRGIQEHTRRHNKQHICELCGMPLASYSELVFHMKTRHKNPDYRYKQPLKLAKAGDRNEEGEFVCEFCPKRYRSSLSLKYHTNQHYNLKPYGCNQCDLKFYDPCRRALHTSRVHRGNKKKSFKCSICKEMFENNYAQKKHIMSEHADMRQYKCDQCPKDFFTYNHLVNHQTLHSQDQSFECDICYKKFTFEAYLTKHHKMHRTHQCDSCGKQFASAKSWREHMKTHRVYSSDS